VWPLRAGARVALARASHVPVLPKPDQRAGESVTDAPRDMTGAHQPALPAQHLGGGTLEDACAWRPEEGWSDTVSKHAAHSTPRTPKRRRHAGATELSTRSLARQTAARGDRHEAQAVDAPRCGTTLRKTERARNAPPRTCCV